MKKYIYNLNNWYYLTGDFFNRVNVQLRKAIKILISVAIGELVLSGFYALFGETVLPTLKERIVDMFNYGK